MFKFENGRLVPDNWSAELYCQFDRIELSGASVTLFPNEDSQWRKLGETIHVHAIGTFAVIVRDDKTLVPVEELSGDALHDFIRYRDLHSSTMKEVSLELYTIATTPSSKLNRAKLGVKWSMIMHGLVSYNDKNDNLRYGDHRRAQAGYFSRQIIDTILHPLLVFSKHEEDPKRKAHHVAYDISLDNVTEVKRYMKKN